jgi:hypothetical protein
MNLSYLSWAWAWAEALKADPGASFKVEMFDGKCFMDINGTAMVFVTVTMFGKPMTCQLPVMDYKTKPFLNQMHSQSIQPSCTISKQNY